MSLIELMTVLAILGLLLGLAWPNYQAHVRRGHRAEAVAALLEAQQFMAQHHAIHGRYTTEAGAAPSLPARLQKIPDQGAVRYELILSSVDAFGFVLQAAPRGALADDHCGSLTLTSTGLKGRTGTGMTVPQCWQ